MTASPTPSVKDVMIAAKKLIEKPENWWPGHDRDPDPTDGEKACIQIAIFRVVDRDFGRDVELARAACDEMEVAIGGSIFKFNDTHSHAEVLAAFDNVIEIAP